METDHIAILRKVMVLIDRLTESNMHGPFHLIVGEEIGKHLDEPFCENGYGVVTFSDRLKMIPEIGKISESPAVHGFCLSTI